MEYLCILNAFKQNYYNRINELEHAHQAATAVAAAASASATAVAHLHNNNHYQQQQQRRCLNTSVVHTATAITAATTAAAITKSTAINSKPPLASLSSVSSSSLTSSPATTNATIIDIDSTTTTAITSTKTKTNATTITATTSAANVKNSAVATAAAAAVVAASAIAQQQKQHQHQQLLWQQHQMQQKYRQHQHIINGVRAVAASATRINDISIEDQEEDDDYDDADDVADDDGQNNTNMANNLLWQPWRDLQHAAAVHHHLYRQQQEQQQQQQLQKNQNHLKENRLTSKELPTAAWRRDRRSRTGEYHIHHISGPSTSTGSSVSPPVPTSLTQVSLPLPLASPVPPKAHSRTPPSSCTSSSSSSISTITIAAHSGGQLSPGANAQQMLSGGCGIAGSGPTIYHQLSPQHHHHHNQHHQHQHLAEDDDDSDGPLDMSLTGSLKQRNSPPPPYREPLPGSNYTNAASTITLARPSVITQAPPKRETTCDGRNLALMTTATRDHDNRSSESIDEHFRRSLGQDYFTLFGKKSPAHYQQMSQTPPSPQLAQHNYQQQQNATPARCDSTPAPSTPTPPTTQPPAYAAINNSGQIQQHVASPSSSSSLSSSSSSPLACVVSPKPNAMITSAASAVQMKTLPIAVVAATNLATTTKASKATTTPYGGKVTNTIQPSAVSLINLKNTTATTANIMSSQPASSSPAPGISTTTAPSNVDASPDSRVTISPHRNKPLQLISRSLASMESSPSTSPSRRTPPAATVNVTLPAVMRVKTEPGMQQHQQSPSQIKNCQNRPPSLSPPVSPSPSNSSTQTLQPDKITKLKAPGTTIVTTTTIIPVSEFSSTSISPPPTQSSTTMTSNSEMSVVPSVDDHFAKALGETWKKLQENKEFHK